MGMDVYHLDNDDWGYMFSFMSFNSPTGGSRFKGDQVTPDKKTPNEDLLDKTGKYITSFDKANEANKAKENHERIHQGRSKVDAYNEMINTANGVWDQHLKLQNGISSGRKISPDSNSVIINSWGKGSILLRTDTLRRKLKWAKL